MIITTKLLERKDACISQVELFQATFGDEAEVTLENCLRAAAVGLDFDWAAQHLLGATAGKQFNETDAVAWKQYDETHATAWKMLDETVATARKLFNETTAPARKRYDEIAAPARKQYDETTAHAWKLFNETVATAGKLYDEARGRAFYKVVNG